MTSEAASKIRNFYKRKLDLLCSAQFILVNKAAVCEPRWIYSEHKLSADLRHSLYLALGQH